MALIRIQLRRGTAAEWLQANPVLAIGEPGLETDTKLQKVGDGVSTWSQLGYATIAPEDVQDALDASAAAGTSAFNAGQSAASALGHKNAAETAAAAAQAVPTTTDGLVKGLLDNPGSATATALSATYATNVSLPAASLGNNLAKAGIVMDVGVAGDFDDGMVESLFPFYDPESGRQAGVYVGYKGGVASIGLAYSDDGVTWTKAGKLIGGSGIVGSPDEVGCSGPVIVYWDGLYYLFRIGLTAVGYEAGTKRIIMSSTPSLKTPVWTHHGVMVQPSGTGWRSVAVWHVSVVQKGALWYMFFNATGSGDIERIGYATAPALTGPWTVDDVNSPLISPPAGATIAGDPDVHRVKGGWRMNYFIADAVQASDWYTTTTDTLFPLGWKAHDNTETQRRVLQPGPAGSYDELYAHKPITISNGGRLFHYYTCVMAGSTFRRIALATDPALPAAGATIGTTLAVNVGRFAQVQTPPAAGNTAMAPSTSFVPLPNLVKARVQAKAGDLLELNFACVLANDGGDARIDAVTYNGSAFINLVSGLSSVGGNGVTAWGASGGRYDHPGGAFHYIVQAADVINGAVTLGVIARTDGATRTFLAGTDPTVFSVRNLS